MIQQYIATRTHTHAHQLPQGSPEHDLPVADQEMPDGIEVQKASESGGGWHLDVRSVFPL
eukprot:4472550-Amphidinium_carterae.7